MPAAEVLSMLKDKASSTGKELAGILDKAVIEIKDKRGTKIQVEAPVPMRGSAQSGALQITSPVSMSALGNSVTTQSAAGALAGLAGQNSGMAGTAAAAAAQVASGVHAGAADSVKYFHVQFNPNELRLNGYGGGSAAKTDFSGRNGGVSLDVMKVRISMDVRLYFDKVDAQDAFMSDKINLAPTALATGAAKAVMSGMGKKEYSVQTEVEGLVAALRSRFTREITFHWGPLCYTGVLNNVDSRYTMFNVQGQPVRAEVDLSLALADQEVSENTLGRWQAKYNEAFGGQNQSFVKAEQKVGNLLNFNL